MTSPRPRHPELVSGSISPDARGIGAGANRAVGFSYARSGVAARWMLKQVQQDGLRAEGEGLV